ncbi:alpha beta-hydrolase isoform B [Chlorella sorokiniana]|uniref:sn-1-specific diacylglycerol lipase n=1 Tax=Chlorella sorokiniana TaxID=3076 RepID=A0A2P6U1X5_CHLSO|nr:alpha beta-hydrolase isoform B [Chlorella sorokiniana]|eukprot:PRW60300.1 alpha beta-hydrolase isoform B [Chlorella sorokiniana]
MPSAKLYGRRWHFSTDIVAIPAGLSGLFHAAWIVILLVWAGATSGWPGHCASHEGAQYAALFGAFLLTFGLNLIVDLLLMWHSLRGAPFEASKRSWVVPLLYASTAPLLLQLGLSAWGAYVSMHLDPDCWPLDKRNAVTNLAQGLVFGTIGFLGIAVIGILITYNAYPQVVRRPDGKRPPLTNIAELTAGLLSHVDLDATDVTAALFLASAAQNRRRRLRIAKALLPMYKAIRSGAAGSSGGGSEEPLSSAEEDNVARLDERLTAAEQLAAAQAGGAPPSTEQVQQAEQLLEDLPASLPDQEVADQLAGAIEAEIRELGGGQLLEEAAALAIHKEESLDLAAVQVDPEAPSIWFSTASSRAAAEGLSSLASGATGASAAAAGEAEGEGEEAEGAGQHAAGEGEESAASTAGTAGQGEALAAMSPFAAAAGAAADSSGAALSTTDAGAEMGRQPAPAGPPGPSEPIPPADEAAAAAVAEVAAAAAAAAAADSGSPQVRARKAASATGASSVGGTSAAGGSVASSRSRLQLDKQLTLRYPTVITPSGRHERVPSEALREALHFLKYSYAVYSLQPKIEAPSSGVDVIFCCGCMASPIDPQKVVFQGLSELEGLEDEEAIELLHLNCRGTISAADIVTDAIVYPEPLDSWLPEDIKQELSEPAFAHAGMAAAAKAIFEDMTERGILQQLVQEEEVGEYVAPEQQEAQRGGGPGCTSTSSEGSDGQPEPGFQHFSMKQHKRAGGGGSEGEADEEGGMSPGRQVGEIMRHKIEQEGWQLIVQGHSLGAGAAALVSLKLRDSFPGLKCLAFCCPGGLVSKHLAHAMRRFTTCVVVGKDAVPRATVSNLSRLMDEMVTALARCKQPKLKVLFFPWWRHRKEQFKDLFWRYDEIPPEPLAMLQHYHESRTSIGHPLPMYPPGRVIFLRPIKTRQSKSWQAVWINPEDIIAEGLLISPHMYRDHLCSTAYEALTEAADAASSQDASSGPPDGRGAAPGSQRSHVMGARVKQDERRRQRAARHRWQQRLAAQRSSSLQEVLVEAM